MNIEIIFEEMKEKKAQVLRRKKLEEQAIADMYATVEKCRIPVAFVFAPSRFMPEVLEITGTLEAVPGAPSETVDIGYLGNLKGADWYVVDDLDAFYAVTLHKFLDSEEGAVAKLVIG